MSLTVSKIGRINILKINILPKLLYLFQNTVFHYGHLQICPQKSKPCLSDLNGTTGGQDFVCLCCLPIDRGGLKCPNLLWYYWAAQLRSVMFYYSTSESPHRTEMEYHYLTLPLPSYIYIQIQQTNYRNKLKTQL